MEELDTTNQVEGAEPETGVEAEVQDEQALDEYGNPVEDQADENEEIDLGDVKLKLSKADAEKAKLAMLRQDDYTRKTQELAEARKAFEAQRQSTDQMDEQELSARANVALIDRQLQQFARTDWNAWNDSDPFEAQKAFQSYQLLKDAKTNAITFLQQAHASRSERQQQETATRLQEAQAQLVKDIPDWSPTLAAKLVEFGGKEYGLSKSDFDNVTDARAVKMIHAAYQWSQHLSKTKTAKTIQKQQEVTPAATVSRAKAPPVGLADNLSNEEWNRRRNAQLAKRGMG